MGQQEAPNPWQIHDDDDDDDDNDDDEFMGMNQILLARVGTNDGLNNTVTEFRVS